jgi:hypothetical protein
VTDRIHRITYARFKHYLPYLVVQLIVYNTGPPAVPVSFLPKVRARTLGLLVLSEWNVLRKKELGEDELDPEPLQRNSSNRKEMNPDSSRALS